MGYKVMKKIDAWRTDDGKVWETEVVAEIHESKLKLTRDLEEEYYRGMIESTQDLVEFLDNYRGRILEYYGAEEK